MISPWTLYKQKKQPSLKEQSEQKIKKKFQARKKGQLLNANLLYQKTKELQNQQFDNQLSDPYQTLQNNSSLSSSFLSHLQTNIQGNKKRSHYLNDQIDKKRSELLRNVDSLSFLKGITMSLQESSQNIYLPQQEQTKFIPIRKFSLQNNPEVSAQKKLLQKLFSLQKLSLKYIDIQHQQNLSNDLQKVNSELLAQKFIYKGQKLSLQKKYNSINRLQNSISKLVQKSSIKNTKGKRRENKFFNPTGSNQNKNIKDLIYQILKRHINFNKQPNQPKQDSQKQSDIQKSINYAISSLNFPIQSTVMLDQKFNNIKQKEKTFNQYKNIVQIETSKDNIKSKKQLISLKQVCLLKRNRKTLSYADEKISKSMLKYSELKSPSKINKNYQQKRKKIKLKKSQLENDFFSRMPSIYKDHQRKQSSSSFSFNQMNKFNDSKIFPQIKYTIPHQNSKRILQD